MNRRGMTLVELLVAMVMGTIVMAGIFVTVVRSQRNARALAERIHVQQNLRTAMQYIAYNVREQDAADGDVMAQFAQFMRIRAPRWMGIICAPPTAVGSGVLIPLRRDLFFGLRDPDPTLDSVLVFQDGEVATRADDQWLHGGVDGIVPAETSCLDGSASLDLTVNASPGSGGSGQLLLGVQVGSPIRGFQVEDLGAAQSGGRWYLTNRTANKAGSFTPMEHLVGPIQADGGLEFTYLDDSDQPADVATSVASIGVTLRFESVEPVRLSDGTIGFFEDSLAQRIALRNNRRF